MDAQTALASSARSKPHTCVPQDGCVTSQFENHLRAILGWPLGDARLNCGSSLMVNILGEAGC